MIVVLDRATGLVLGDERMTHGEAISFVQSECVRMRGSGRKKESVTGKTRNF